VTATLVASQTPALSVQGRLVERFLVGLVAPDMSGAWTLGREPGQSHELISAAQVHRFAKLLLNPVLNHFAAPDDAPIKIFAQTGGELLLLRLG